jgi:hypothetical protein
VAPSADAPKAEEPAVPVEEKSAPPTAGEAPAQLAEAQQADEKIFPPAQYAKV